MHALTWKPALGNIPLRLQFKFSIQQFFLYICHESELYKESDYDYVH